MEIQVLFTQPTLQKWLWFTDNSFYQGVSGTVQLDSNGDRIGDYWLWDMKESENVYQKWAEIRMSDKEANLQVCIMFS